MKINNRKIISILLMLGMFFTISPVNALSLKGDKAGKVTKATKSTDKLMNETLQKSVVKEEYKSGDKVLENEPPANQDDRDFIIQGSVEKSLDVDLCDCLKLALGNNPKIKVALNNALASHARIKEAWSNYFPTLNWGTSYSNMRNLQTAAMTGVSNDFNYYILGQITLSQILYDFGVTQNTVTIKKLDYEAYKTSLTGVINDVIYQTKDAYYNLLFCYDNKRVAQDTVKKYEMFYNQAKAFYDIGLNPKVDVMIAEVNLSNAKLKLIQAENSIDMAVAALNNTMGVPYLNKYNVQEKLQFNPVKITMSDAFELAKQSRPELKLADIKIKEADQAVKLAKKAYFPKLSAQGSYARGGESFNNTYGYNYGIYLNFPTVNGMLIQNQIKEATSLYDSQLADAQSTKNDVYLEIQQAFLSLYEKKNQIPVALTQVKQAKENYDISFGRYKVGVGNPTELKDAQNSYETAQLSYYQALYQYNSAKAQLEKAVGKNIVGEQEIGLNIEL